MGSSGTPRNPPEPLATTRAQGWALIAGAGPQASLAVAIPRAGPERDPVAGLAATIGEPGKATKALLHLQTAAAAIARRLGGV